MSERGSSGKRALVKSSITAIWYESCGYVGFQKCHTSQFSPIRRLSGPSVMSAPPHVGAWHPPPPSSASAASSRVAQGFRHGLPMGFVTGRPWVSSRGAHGFHQWPSVTLSGHHRCQAIIGARPSSEAIRGHQRPSEAIRGHQRPSVALVPAVSPQTPKVDVREGRARCPLATAMPARIRYAIRVN